MANLVHEKHAGVSIDVINVSKSDEKKIAAPYYPYIVFYPKGPISKAKGFDKNSFKKDSLVQFLKENGIDM